MWSAPGLRLGVSERVRVLNGVIYLLDGDRVLSVNPVTGSRTLISGGGVGTGPAFALAESVTTDATGGSLMVLDQNFGGTGALIRVNLATGNRTEVFSNRLQTGTTNFDMPYDVVRNACDNSFYVLHTGATGVLGNVMRVNATGTRTLFATYTASSPSSNYSVLMRPLILLPGGGGPGGPGGARRWRWPVTANHHQSSRPGRPRGGQAGRVLGSVRKPQVDAAALAFAAAFSACL